MNRISRWLARAVGVPAFIGGVAVMSMQPDQPVAARAALADEGPMPELDGAVAWLNSAPLSRESLRGKVVLVNFWTYSCINSLRELPYVKGWAAKYKDAGLVVIGAHAPEFGFEKERANVAQAVRNFNVTYPVPIDSGHRIWQAFSNEAWPADYFIDAKGRIRYRHFGEGDYERSEQVIRDLLKEAGATGLDTSVVRPSAEGAEAPPSLDVRSPETYLGFARAENFASPEGLERDSPRMYSQPSRLTLNQWGLSGVWKIGAESAVLQESPGKIAFRFFSRDVHMVVAPSQSGKPVRFRVRLDGASPGGDHGVDSDGEGAGEAREPRMYQLIRQKGPLQERTFEIEFLDPGVQGFSFTFG